MTLYLQILKNINFHTLIQRDMEDEVKVGAGLMLEPFLITLFI